MKFTKEMTKQLAYITRVIDDRVALELLAEEAAELSQAALKIIRTRSTMLTNPCEITQRDAIMTLNLELVDVALASQAACATIFGVSEQPTGSADYERAFRAKLQRWAVRLGYKVQPAKEKKAKKRTGGDGGADDV